MCLSNLQQNDEKSGLSYHHAKEECFSVETANNIQSASNQAENISDKICKDKFSSNQLTKSTNFSSETVNKEPGRSKRDKTADKSSSTSSYETDLSLNDEHSNGVDSEKTFFSNETEPIVKVNVVKRNKSNHENLKNGKILVFVIPGVFYGFLFIKIIPISSTKIYRNPIFKTGMNMLDFGFYE